MKNVQDICGMVKEPPQVSWQIFSQGAPALTSTTGRNNATRSSPRRQVFSSSLPNRSGFCRDMSASRLPLLPGASVLRPLSPKTPRWPEGSSGRISEAVQPVLRQGRVQAASSASLLSFSGTQGVLAGCHSGGPDPAAKENNGGQYQPPDADVFHFPRHHCPLAPVFSERISSFRIMATNTGTRSCCHWRPWTAGASGRFFS